MKEHLTPDHHLSQEYGSVKRANFKGLDFTSVDTVVTMLNQKLTSVSLVCKSSTRKHSQAPSSSWLLVGWPKQTMALPALEQRKGNWHEPLRSQKCKAELSPVAFSDGPDRRRGRAFVWPVVEGPAGLASECVYLSETVDFLAGETAWTV